MGVQNFTAIIGANGSGKSNVIDSLLFVFGYRAAKIRSKKVSLLIHSSAGRDDIRSCTVTVHFQKIVDKVMLSIYIILFPCLNHIQDRNEFGVVESSKFYVSRTAFRDNSSRYTVSGQTMSFKEVGLFLRENGVDLVHNRFLILQVKNHI